jgi:hypothetical protein
LIIFYDSGAAYFDLQYNGESVFSGGAFNSSAVHHFGGGCAAQLLAPNITLVPNETVAPDETVAPTTLAPSSVAPTTLPPTTLLRRHLTLRQLSLCQQQHPLKESEPETAAQKIPIVFQALWIL